MNRRNFVAHLLGALAAGPAIANVTTAADVTSEAALMADTARLLAESTTAVERLRASTAGMRALFESGMISQETYSRALTGAGSMIQKVAL